MLLNSIYRIDPTRTLTLRDAFASQMSKRFNALKRDIKKSIVTNDAFGLKETPVINEPIPPNQYRFERDPEKVVLFLQWLQSQIDKGILDLYYGVQVGEAIEEQWTNYYISVAYERGIARAWTELKSIGFAIPEAAVTSIAMNGPFHIDRVGLLYTRTFTGLKGITDEMSKQVSVILAEGMSQGEGPLEIANKINSRVESIGLTRAKVLARTEVIRAHHQAMMQEFKNLGVLGVRVLAEWSTAGDGNVCPICAPLNGTIYTIERAMNLIPKHPNCRCIAIPLDVTDNPELLKKIQQEEAAA